MVVGLWALAMLVPLAPMADLLVPVDVSMMRVCELMLEVFLVPGGALTLSIVLLV